MMTLDIETTGLHPSPTPQQQVNGMTEDFITCIGVMDDYGLTCLAAPLESYKRSLFETEETILKSFRDYFYEIASPDDCFLTYNGVVFDIPFIASRCARHGFDDVAKNALETKDVDLQRYVQFATRTEDRLNGIRFSKDSACRSLGNLYIPKKTEGLWTARIYKNPSLLTIIDHLDMLQHNATDLAATAKLYSVVKGFPDFAAWRKEEFKGEV